MSAAVGKVKSIDYATSPTPSYILRGHTAQISVLAFSLDARTLYSGDIDGWVGAWDLETFRPRLFWKAHESGMLTIEPYLDGVLTHARDNKIHYYELPTAAPSISRSAASAVPSAKDPSTLSPTWSLDVNALAYCKMSVLPIPDAPAGTALVAVTALTKDELIDIFHLPTLDRVHRSIGASLVPTAEKIGSLLALSLFCAPTPDATLHLLAGYEDGRVVLFKFTGTKSQAFDPPTARKEEGELWDVVWEETGHRDAVMAISLSPDNLEAWSIAADHFVCRYRLFDSEETKSIPRMERFETTAPGRGAIGIRSDGRLVAVAGWDGETRLYSTKSGRPLAVLSYHRSSLHALAFAPLPLAKPPIKANLSDDDDDSDDEESSTRPWLAVGGKDTTTSLWEVYPPE